MDISPAVQKALAEKLPIVALESTIITHGKSIKMINIKGMEYPQNKITAQAVEEVIRKNGAVPATIAILDGRIKIGNIEISY